MFVSSAYNHFYSFKILLWELLFFTSRELSHLLLGVLFISAAC